MAEDYRRSVEELTQGSFLDDPGFLRQIVERVLQEMLEAQMSDHLGALPPTSAPRSEPGTATATSPERSRAVLAR